MELMHTGSIPWKAGAAFATDWIMERFEKIFSNLQGDLNTLSIEEHNGEAYVLLVQRYKRAIDDAIAAYDNEVMKT